MERTVVNFSTEFDKISPDDSMILLGSCFSENIGKALSKHKFDAVSNPFGIVFHPFSTYNLLKRAMENRYFDESDFFERDAYWFSFELGANTGKESVEEAVLFCNSQLEELHNKLKKESRLMLTFGSSFGYVKEGKFVANCHKVNGNQFAKKASTLNELTLASEAIITQLHQFNPKLKIYLTVSPIRHVKEGLRENNLSKSALLLLTRNLELQFSYVEYIPMYELLMDEFRDYSFYNEDLIHLNPQTINKVWNRFISWMMNDESLKKIKEVSKILKQLEHKPLYPKSQSTVSFKKALVKQMKEDSNSSWLTEIQRLIDDLLE